MVDQTGDVPHLATGVPAGHGDFLLERRYRVVAPYLPSGEGLLLDFGCGNGAQTFHFFDHFAQVVGLDVTPGFLAEFRAVVSERRLSEKVDPIEYDGTTIPLDDASVDCAVSFTVLEHVEDEAAALRELHRVVKPGGRLIMSVPNRWWIFETHGADLPLLPWNRVPFVSWWPRPLHDRYARARIYEKREIEEKITAQGFELENSFYITAPMDVLSWKPLRSLLRKTVFRGDTTGNAFLATEALVVARRSSD